MPDALWRDKATEWIYTLRERSHGLNNELQKLVGEVSAMRGDVDSAVKSLHEMSGDMRQAREATVEMKAVIGFLKWALPLSVALSGAIVGIITVATRK